MTPAQLGALSDEHVRFHNDKTPAASGGGADLLALAAGR